jgi:glycosyltransferase involved in cell wall biosynthesis
MHQLAAFARYLARAQGCVHIASLGRADVTAPSDALGICRIEAGAGAVLPETLARLRAAIVTCPAALVLFERNLGLTDTEVSAQLADAGLATAFVGTPGGVHEHGCARVAILDRAERAHPAGEAAPEHFRVLAIVPVYNEEDIIARTLQDIISQGLEVWVIDNWSTDCTFEHARAFLGRGVVGLERFPRTAPARTYDLRALMARVEDLAREQAWASWVVLHDADERRRSPWRDVSLRDALWHAECCGYSCVDHVTLNFWPVDDDFDLDARDLEAHFEYFEFSRHPGHFHQRRAWKRTSELVKLVPSAGHDVTFAGRRVYPYKFLLKHYPIRSRAHGERKVLRERATRWNLRERALGWHRQYDELTPESFIRDPATLTRFDSSTFSRHFLLERLSGVGVFEAPPAWATPPYW